MARLVNFVTPNSSFQASVQKIDRNRIYGWVEKEYKDDNQVSCETATLLNDGQTILISGGLAFKTVDSEGRETEKSSLVAKNSDMSDAILYPSIYDEDVVLSPATLETLYNLDVSIVYELIFDSEEESIKACDVFKETTLYSFKFNYRTDYEAADAILLKKSDFFFILTGTFNSFEYLDNPNFVESIEDDEDSGDEILDFEMF